MTTTNHPQSLTITGYVGHSYPDVLAGVEADVQPIEAALAAAGARVEQLATPSPISPEVEVEGDGNVLRLRTDVPELDGAVVSFTPVGTIDSRLTAVTVRLGEPFVGGESGRRQFLAATCFLSGSADALEHRLAG